MKKIFSLVTLIAVVTATMINFSCKKDKESYTCATCNATPKAVAANDASSKGIYRGVVVGSSGTIEFDINNTLSTITAVMVLDGVTVNLTSAVAWQAGVAYTAPFTGTMNGSPVSITFSVAFNGLNAQIVSSNIPGHPHAYFKLLKETSTALIEGFEGTYSSTDGYGGTFNILLSRQLQKWTGVSKENGTNDGEDAGEGIMRGDQLIYEDMVIGTLNGDKLDGRFTDSGETTTVTGKRTL